MPGIFRRQPKKIAAVTYLHQVRATCRDGDASLFLGCVFPRNKGLSRPRRARFGCRHQRDAMGHPRCSGNVLVHLAGPASTQALQAVNMPAVSAFGGSSGIRGVAVKPIIGAVGVLLAGLGYAVAADMPLPGPAPVPPPAYYPAYYNWSGVYIGVNAGGGFGSSTFRQTSLR